MIQKTNSKNIVSWLYPSETYLNLDNELLLMQDINEQNHVQCLEFIIDRLYVIVNLINDYLDIMVKTPTYKNVYKPKKVTLSSSVHNLWERIQKLDLATQNQNTYGENPTHSKNTPIYESNNENTAKETHSLRCTNCEIAMKCIKTISEEIVTLGKSESIVKARSEMREIIFDASQSESMNLISSAITHDIRVLAKFCTKLEHKANETEQSLKSLNYEHQDALKKLEFFEETVHTLKESQLKEKEKRKTMSLLLNKIYHEKRQTENFVKTKEELINTLRIEIEENMKTIYTLQNDADKLKEATLEAIKRGEILSAEKELWKMRFTHAHEESTKVKAANEELRKGMCAVEDKIDVIDGDFKNLGAKIDRNVEDIDKNKQAYEKLLKKTQDVVNSKVIVEDKVNNNILRCKHNMFATNDIEVQGNPLIDMTKQVEINNINILKLEAQNGRLTKTIEKYKQISHQ